MATANYGIDTLPELPLEVFELTGKLDFAGVAPILTIKPREVAVPQPPASPTPLAKKSSFFVRKYLTQVTYPRVICYPETAWSDKLAWKASKLEDNEQDIELIARHERFFKLSSFDGLKLGFPYFCQVKYGPWSAVVIEETSCIQGVPNHWRLFITEIPEVELSWYGTWDDIPPYPSLHVFMGDLYLVNEAHVCCPGYHWCPTTQSCIPITVECKDPTPV